MLDTILLKANEKANTPSLVGRQRVIRRFQRYRVSASEMRQEATRANIFCDRGQPHGMRKR